MIGGLKKIIIRENGPWESLKQNYGKVPWGEIPKNIPKKIHA